MGQWWGFLESGDLAWLEREGKIGRTGSKCSEVWGIWNR